MTYPQKAKNSWLKPEEVQTDITYSLTINPSDDYQCLKSNALNRFRVFQKNMDIMLDKLYNYVTDCKLYIEISAQGRLHMHGTFKIKDILAFYLIVPYYFSTWCASEMDTIKDPEIWYTYCTKSSEYMKELVCIDQTKKDNEDDEPLIVKHMKIGKTINIKAE